MRLAKKLKSDDKVVFPECRDSAVRLVFDDIASFEVLASLAEWLLVILTELHWLLSCKMMWIRK